MKTSFFVPFSILLLATASPLGNRALFEKDHAVSHTRRYLLQSRLDSPFACAALPFAKTSVTPSVSNLATVGNSTLVNKSTDAEASTSSRRRRAWKRIAQDDLTDVALSWQRLCLESGGDILTRQPCVNLAGGGGIDALLANADPCAQQDIADAMVTFAKSPGVKNRNALIANAITYRQHPRNAVDILGVVPSTPYCQRRPNNPELMGIVNKQLEGVSPGLFGSPVIPIVPFGALGTCPFGLTPNLATCTCVVKASVTAKSYTDALNSAMPNASTVTVGSTGNSTSIGGSAAATSANTSSAVAKSNITASAASTSGVASIAGSKSSAVVRASITSSAASKTSAGSSSASKANATSLATSTISIVSCTKSNKATITSLTTASVTTPVTKVQVSTIAQNAVPNV